MPNYSLHMGRFTAAFSAQCKTPYYSFENCISLGLGPSGP